MGYTNYWKFKKNPIDIENGAEKFKRAVENIKEYFTNMPVKVLINSYDGEVKEKSLELFGGNGYGKPVFGDKVICFNGDARKGLEHESFYIALDYSQDGGMYSFDFCKTAQKPYDFAVCFALLCIKAEFRDDFEFSSDGEIKKGECGWMFAKKEAKRLGIL